MNQKATTGGILTIISGAIGIVGSLLAFALLPMIRTILTDPQFQDPSLTPSEMELLIDFTTAFVGFWGVFGVILSVFAIVAGVYTTRRRAWGLGLAGAIVSLFLFFPTGVPALILTVLARPEFAATGQQPNAVGPAG